MAAVTVVVVPAMSAPAALITSVPWTVRPPAAASIPVLTSVPVADTRMSPSACNWLAVSLV
ncbi:hypothetical protein D9M68_879110 [compost metagenome]